MGDRQEPNVVLPEDRLLPSTSSNTSPSLIGLEHWSRAEKVTHDIIRMVQPTVVSEERRKEVIDYVQRLISGCLSCEVFPYGSVPLITYLPDGDIDLTVFGGVSLEDAMANEMVSVLEAEDQNREAEFLVKDVQLISAEVKLVKCIVQNIVVDISFNQIGGLCTLCFLEQVNRLIGKDHLFKRSIILIKAWCYYESRILGAHHGLISTCALETLVLYIFHLFHSTLNGPLAVLYKFLNYFSKFDWDNYGISLTGPFCISSLPEIVVETPEIEGGDLLLTDDFLRYCVDMFSVPSKDMDINSRTFPQKHLNIVDPLKENNNLGRSVSKGNFYRIRSAFTYGARKLGRILLQQENSIGNELLEFFSNTLDRHGSGQRPDVQDLVHILPHNGLNPAISVLETKSCKKERGFSELHSPKSPGMNGDYKFNPEDALLDVKLPECEVKLSRTDTGEQRGSVELLPSTMSVEAQSPIGKGSPLGNCCGSDAKDLTNSRIQRLKISDDSSSSFPQNGEENKSPLAGPYHAPHLYFSNSDNGKLRSRNLDQEEFKRNYSSEGKVFSGSMHEFASGAILTDHDQDKSRLVCSDEFSSLRKPEDVPSHQLCYDRTFASTSASSKSLKILSDLSGDYDSHFNCLQYGRWCYEYAATPPALSMSPSPLSQFQDKAWDDIQRSSHFKQNGFPHVASNNVIHANGVIPSSAYYNVNLQVIPCSAFGLEEMPKPRGTGTYFPRTNRPPHGYRPSTVKGRSQGAVRSPRNNGLSVPFMEANVHERNSRELLQLQFPFDHGGRSGSPDVHHYIPPGKKFPNNINGFRPYGVEFGPVRQVSRGEPSIEIISQTRDISSHSQISSQARLTSPRQKWPKAAMTIERDSVELHSTYHLKDDDDFPPLSF